MSYAKHPGGRHAAEKGSLTVAELLARRAPDPVTVAAPVRTAPVRTAVEILPATAPRPVAAPAVPEELPVTRTRHRAAYRFGRTVVAGGLTALVIAAMAAAALTGSPAPERPSAAAVEARTAALTGTDALRPDIVAGELRRVGSAAAPATAEPGAVAAPPVTVAPKRAVPTPRSLPTDPVPAGPTGTATPPVTDEDAPLAPPGTDTLWLVQEFFTSLPTHPETAVTLLDPVLAAVDPGAFNRAWRGVRAVEVHEVTRQDDGRVLASVLLAEPDGERLRAEYLLTLSEGSAPRIVEVLLVSAQRG